VVGADGFEPPTYAL